MTAVIIKLADHRKRQQPRTIDLFDTLEFVALANIAVIYGFIAAFRIIADARRPHAGNRKIRQPPL